MSSLSEVLGPLALRHFSLEKPCQENQGHTHNYDHVTFVLSGAVRVFYCKPGESEETSKDFRHNDEQSYFLVLAGVEHRIKALEPNTRYACVYAHFDHEGVAVQEYVGAEAAYV